MWKNVQMHGIRVQHFIGRATDYLEAMRLTQRNAYLNAAALLAIHCALSYSDALRTGLGSDTLSSDDHRYAVSDLEQLVSKKRISDRTGITQLAGLLSKKSKVAYGSKRLAIQDFSDLVTKAERFVRWANNVGKELKIEGWRNAD